MECQPGGGEWELSLCLPASGTAWVRAGSQKHWLNEWTQRKRSLEAPAPVVFLPGLAVWIHAPQKEGTQAQGLESPLKPARDQRACWGLRRPPPSPYVLSMDCSMDLVRRG